MTTDSTPTADKARRGSSIGTRAGTARNDETATLQQLQEHLVLEEDLADSTVYLYGTYWRRWHRWSSAQRGVDPRRPTILAVRAWSNTLPPGTSNRDNAKAAIRYWCVAEGIDDVSEAVARPERNSRSDGRQLTRAEARALLAAADRAGEDGHAIYFGLFAGLRISEICRLRWEYCDLRAGELRYRRIKGGEHWHTTGLHPILADLAEPYIATGGGWVYPWLHEGHLGVEAVRTRVVEVVEDAGLPIHPDPDKVTMHALRRTHGRRIYEQAWFDLTVPQKALGHLQARTTGLYIKSDLDKVKAAVQQITYDEPDRTPRHRRELIELLQELLAAELADGAPSRGHLSTAGDDHEEAS